LYKRILIVGIESFTGKYLSDRLHSSGYEVFGTVRDANSSNKNIFKCDLLNKKNITNLLLKIKPTHVIHLSAISYVPDGQDLEVYNVNLFGTLNLLDSIKKTLPNISKVIISSSAAIYGNNQGLIDEAESPNPVNHYGMSKLAMEYMVKNNFEDEFPILFLRPFNYTGIYQSQKFIIPKIINAFREQSRYIDLGDITIERDFSDVRDVVEAYILLMNSSIECGAYNVCSGSTKSLVQIIDYCKKISGHSIEIKKDYNLFRKNEIKSLVGCNKKLIEIGWKPKYGITNTIDWMFGGINVKT
jgi:nucleoside-diphosphate-sugar epimerase